MASVEDNSAETAPPIVKVCGITSVVDAVMCAEAGVDWIGVNFWSGTARRCDPAVARSIVGEVGAAVRVVGVFVGAPLEEIRLTRQQTGIDWVQLHGMEPPAVLSSLLPHAYKALHVTGPSVVGRAMLYEGPLVLLDASAPGMMGGTGRTFDWEHAAELAGLRPVIVAGGLTPDNVAVAQRRVRPFGVDVASGVERTPGVKDRAKVRAFVAAAKGP